MFNIYWGCHFSRKSCESVYNDSFRVLINDTGSHIWYHSDNFETNTINELFILIRIFLFLNLYNTDGIAVIDNVVKYRCE